MTKDFHRIGLRHVGVIGGGAWGTALAALSASHESGPGDTILWARNAEVVESINRHHINPLYLPGACPPPARSPAAMPPSAPPWCSGSAGRPSGHICRTT